MAKDPAFLFYVNDWLGGTMTLTRHQKGCYIDLIVAQFNSGHLDIEAVKTVLGADYPLWQGILSKKFIVDQNGCFYNERLELEINKRAAYGDSRRKNRNAKKEIATNPTHDDTYVEPMSVHMDNENRNINVLKEEGVGEGAKKWNTKPGPEWHDLELPVLKINSAIEFLRFTKNVAATSQQVIALWNVFKINNLDGENFYPSVAKVHTHFLNWLKFQQVSELVKNMADKPLKTIEQIRREAHELSEKQRLGQWQNQ